MWHGEYFPAVDELELAELRFELVFLTHHASFQDECEDRTITMIQM
jgi:hypothetical protein